MARRLLVLWALFRCAWHGAFRWPPTHRVCDFHGAETSDPVAVWCSCGRVFLNELSDGELELVQEFLIWTREGS
jgi:hypothetical protein